MFADRLKTVSMAPLLIDQLTSDLRTLGAKEVDQYEQKLRSFGSNERKVFELLSEARAALHFLRNGWTVTMRDRPDLKLEFDGHTIFAEVKHINEKETDRRDEAAMAAKPFQFVKVGNVFEDEGSDAWQQMFEIAKKKEQQYLEGEQNILIFVSYSESMGLMLSSAVHEFDDAVRAQGSSSKLRKLGGMMLLTTDYPVMARSNVEFEITRWALHRISPAIWSVLGSDQFA